MRTGMSLREEEDKNASDTRTTAIPEGRLMHNTTNAGTRLSFDNSIGHGGGELISQIIDMSLLTPIVSRNFIELCVIISQFFRE